MHVQLSSSKTPSIGTSRVGQHHLLVKYIADLLKNPGFSVSILLPLELCCTCSWKFSSSRVCSSPLLDQRSLLWCHLLSWISGNWNVKNVILSFHPEWIPNVRQFVNLPFLCCFASCSHRVLENFKEDVVEMGWYIGGGHRALDNGENRIWGTNIEGRFCCSQRCKNVKN